MNRLEFLKTLSLFSVGAISLPNSNLFKTSPFTPLRNNVGIFSMQGGTIGWFTTDDAIVVIDSQFPDPAREFLNGIGQYGEGPEKVLFNTHHHGDHTGGNQEFEKESYRIIAHDNVPGLQRRSAEANDTEDAQAYAQTTFAHKFELSVGSEKITAEYYGPAHTNGDSVIWFEQANIAHMGDLLFNRLYPFIDRDGGALITGWIELLETVHSMADSETLFIYGHGNPEFGVTGRRDDLLIKRDFLTELFEHTQRGIQAGRSREEIIQTEQFDNFSDFISPSDFLSLPRNLDIAYRELTEAK